MKKYLLLIVAAVAAITTDAQLVKVYKGDASSPIFTLADADSVVWAQELPSEADTTAYDKAISLTWTATNFAIQYNTVVRDENTYYFIYCFDDGYYEQWIQGGGNDHSFNESTIGWIEASHYYTEGSEITPYQIATQYCKKGNIANSFQALDKNTKYEIIAFTYDYVNDMTGDVTYVWHAQTTNVDTTHVYPVDMTIELAWNGTTLQATPSISTQKYVLDALPISSVSKCKNADEVAEVALGIYGGSVPSDYCSIGSDSWDYFYACYNYWYDSDTIVGFAFGVGTDGKICSQPVWAKIANPYYSSSSGYDDYWSPARQATNAESKAAIARIYKGGAPVFVVANADSLIFTSAKEIEPLTFDVDVTNISDSSATIQVTPSDSTARYFWFNSDSVTIAQYGSSVQEAAQYLITNNIKAYIDSYNETYSTSYTFYDFPDATYRAYQGVDKATFTSLSAQKEYMVIVFKVTELCDVIDEPLSPLTVKTFRTEAKKE